jgi:hypothetical protein
LVGEEPRETALASWDEIDDGGMADARDEDGGKSLTIGDAGAGEAGTEDIKDEPIRR